MSEFGDRRGFPHAIDTQYEDQVNRVVDRLEGLPPELPGQLQPEQMKEPFPVLRIPAPDLRFCDIYDVGGCRRTDVPFDQDVFQLLKEILSR